MRLVLNFLVVKGAAAARSSALSGDDHCSTRTLDVPPVDLTLHLPLLSLQHRRT